jgi:hypothetical protein
MTTIKIVNTETGEETEREMNANELAQQAIDQAEVEATKATQATKATEKAALLAKLGITDDEAKLLLS